MQLAFPSLSRTGRPRERWLVNRGNRRREEILARAELFGRSRPWTGHSAARVPQWSSTCASGWQLTTHSFGEHLRPCGSAARARPGAATQHRGGTARFTLQKPYLGS